MVTAEQFADVSRRMSVLYHIHSSGLMVRCGFADLKFGLTKEERINGDLNYWLREPASGRRPLISFERIQDTNAGMLLNAIKLRAEYRLIIAGPQTIEGFAEWYDAEVTIDIIWETLSRQLHGAMIPFYDFRSATYVNNVLTAPALPARDFMLQYVGTTRANELTEQDRNKINMRFSAEV